MTAPPTIDVKVIFDASSRARRGSTRVVPRPRGAAAKGWRVLAGLHLLVAFTSYYVTWWRVDPFLYLTFMLKTPVDVDMDQAAALFVPPQRGADHGAVEPNALSADEILAQRTGAQRTRTVIGATAYGWLALTTLSTSILGMAGGAALARSGPPVWKRYAILLAVSAALLLFLATAIDLAVYGRQYPTTHLRLGMGLLLFLAASIGAILGNRASTLTRFAAIGLIVAAAGTVVALYLGASYEALEPRFAALSVVALAFAIQSGYGWLALLLRRWLA